MVRERSRVQISSAAPFSLNKIDNLATYERTPPTLKVSKIPYTHCTHSENDILSACAYDLYAETAYTQHVDRAINLLRVRQTATHKNVCTNGR